jgi:hypothetical protein
MTTIWILPCGKVDGVENIPKKSFHIIKICQNKLFDMSKKFLEYFILLMFTDSPNNILAFHKRHLFV